MYHFTNVLADGDHVVQAYFVTKNILYQRNTKQNAFCMIVS